MSCSLTCSSRSRLPFADFVVGAAIAAKFSVASAGTLSLFHPVFERLRGRVLVADDPNTLVDAWYNGLIVHRKSASDGGKALGSDPGMQLTAVFEDDGTIETYTLPDEASDVRRRSDVPPLSHARLQWTVPTSSRTVRPSPTATRVREIAVDEVGWLSKYRAGTHADRPTRKEFAPITTWSGHARPSATASCQAKLPPLVLGTMQHPIGLMQFACCMVCSCCMLHVISLCSPFCQACAARSRHRRCAPRSVCR